MAVAFPEVPEPFVPELANQNCLSIEEARNAIKAKFTSYRQLLDKKELELLSELNQIEERNKPELIHLRIDLKRLRGVVDTLDDSLGTNTLTSFLEKQKSIWVKEIENFEKSERLLSHLTLNFSDFNQFVDNIIKIVPFRTKARFRTDLEPLLELELKVGEEWFVVSQKWFSEFTAAINLNNPQNYDSWEFPECIPIDHSDIYANGQIINGTACKTSHSKAWNLLLGFNNLLPSHPIKRMPYLNPLSHKVELPIVPITHKCYIGYISGTNQFNIEIDLNCFPSETYAEVSNRISHFSNLITTFPPKLFCYKRGYSITFDSQNNKYTVNKPNLTQWVSPPVIPGLP